MAKRRKGRGRLSAIEKLPIECEEAVVWAATELRKRQRSQKDIYEEFFLKLEQVQKDSHGELEFDIPSISSFNRYSINQAHLTRRIEGTREIASSIAA
ncbi:MAG: DUF3486 family protein, partial [Roseibium sp.]|uniref:phage protein Gp27 family protein n=1 Tax=Roseibium sp. TaxID=1936156 RepID=UPI002613B7D1